MMQRAINFIVSILIVVVLGYQITTRSQEISVASAQSGTPASRGYIVAAEDLHTIRSLAEAGGEPYASNVARLLENAGSPETWSYGTVGGAFNAVSGLCYSENSSNGVNFLHATKGGHEVYRKMLAYHLSGNINYAISAREKILDLTDTYSFGGNVYSGSNECILVLGFSIPTWIQSADLLEGVPIWSASDKVQFQNWLAQEVYPKVAWASRVRVNNWGSAGSLAASMIGDYLWDRSINLVEVSPAPLTLSPLAAYESHNQQQLARMNGDARFASDTRCSHWGIQPYGGIPDELRRGSTGCEGQWIEDNDSSLSYTTTQVELLIFHAEFLMRRCSDAIYANVTADGKGSLLKAILFVLDNPISSSSWVDSRRGNLYVALQYYGDLRLRTEAQQLSSFKGGSSLPYGPLTHAFSRSYRVCPSQQLRWN